MKLKASFTGWCADWSRSVLWDNVNPIVKFERLQFLFLFKEKYSGLNWLYTGNYYDRLWDRHSISWSTGTGHFHAVNQLCGHFEALKLLYMHHLSMRGMGKPSSWPCKVIDLNKIECVDYYFRLVNWLVNLLNVILLIFCGIEWLQLTFAPYVHAWGGGGMFSSWPCMVIELKWVELNVCHLYGLTDSLNRSAGTGQFYTIRSCHEFRMLAVVAYASPVDESSENVLFLTS